MKPVVEFMFVDFTTIAMDQIINQAAKIRYMTGGQAKCQQFFEPREERELVVQPNIHKALRIYFVIYQA